LSAGEAEIADKKITTTQRRDEAILFIRRTLVQPPPLYNRLATAASLFLSLVPHLLAGILYTFGVAAEIQTISIESSSGALEALLNLGAADATFAAVVCHPHPLYGGPMHNKVVFHAMKALNGFGFPVLRFNFRGTGNSAGEHDFGRGEQDDVRAALAWLRDRYTLPIMFAGFSFGASVGLRACCDDADVKALISIGTPMGAEDRQYRYDFLAHCPQPKLFVSGARDQYGPASELLKLVDSVAEPKKLVLVEGVDHFFEPDGLPAMRSAIEEWVRELAIRGAVDERQ
jgi:uncharacterized protein